MGKRIISQHRGHGSLRYCVAGHRHKANVIHLPQGISGTVLSFALCPGHSAPLALVRHDFGDSYIFAPEGLAIGDAISTHAVSLAAVLPLGDIPEGTLIHNIEAKPGDGGKFVRAAGTSARVVTKRDNEVIVIMPSRRPKTFLATCRAGVGVLAGGGKDDKPFVKAGKHYHAARARGGKIYPRTSAVAMNATDHPFGSGRGRHIGKCSIAPRHAPPGRKVGLVRPRRTGRKR